MQGQFIGGKFVTRAAVEKYSQCFPQPRIVVGVGGQAAQYLGDPNTGSFEVFAQQRRGRKPRITVSRDSRLCVVAS